MYQNIGSGMIAVLPLWFVLPTIKCNHAVHLIVIKHVSCHICDTFVICIKLLNINNRLSVFLSLGETSA